MLHKLVDRTVGAGTPAVSDIVALLDSRGSELRRLQQVASELRDEGLEAEGRPRTITYSRKVFIPVTRLCRDRCHYCAFVETPGRLRRQRKDMYISEDQAVAIALRGQRLGCKEALLTLGDRPEDRWPEARAWLDEHGFESTIHYVAHIARRIMEETTLLPHANPGVMHAEEMSLLREFSPSLGMMLETTSERLWAEKGQVHYGSPDKNPALRLQVLEDAGKLSIPFTSGALFGIGETPIERAETLIALQQVHREFGSLQEVIVQNFLPKPGTASSGMRELEPEEYLAAIATARLVLGPTVHLQAPPNLSDPGLLSGLIASGIDDWGGVSPLTVDHVNPERPWPELRLLAQLTQDAGYALTERLTVYPEFVRDAETWISPRLRVNVSRLADASGLAKIASSSSAQPVEPYIAAGVAETPTAELLTAAAEGAASLSAGEYARILGAENGDLEHLRALADDLRKYTVGECVTFVRNHAITLAIPYSDFPDPASLALALESAAITELCIQGVPNDQENFTRVLDFVSKVSTAAPSVHLHAFRPADVVRMAEQSGRGVADVYEALRDAGVRTVTGTGIKILDEEWRRRNAPEDLPVDAWRSALETAHEIGMKSTAVIGPAGAQKSEMIVDHLLALRHMQRNGGGFTELIPLPWPNRVPLVAERSLADDMQAITAVARLILGDDLTHIQVPWPRVERRAVLPLLQSGADDLGGTLESLADPNSLVNEDSFLEREMASVAQRLARTLRARNAWYLHPGAVI